TGMERKLLRYWVTRYPEEEVAALPVWKAARLLRRYAEQDDPLARQVFGQQAMALGRLFTIAANFTDPDAYFVGGGVVESAPRFRQWFLSQVPEHTVLRQEQADAATLALVRDLDMAGARGSALAAQAFLQAPGALAALPDPAAG